MLFMCLFCYKRKLLINFCSFIIKVFSSVYFFFTQRTFVGNLGFEKRVKKIEEVVYSNLNQIQTKFAAESIHMIGVSTAANSHRIPRKCDVTLLGRITRTPFATHRSWWCCCKCLSLCMLLDATVCVKSRRKKKIK